MWFNCHMEIGQVWIILASAAFGGAGTKIVDSLVKRYKRKIDSTAQLRQELRDEAEGLRLENHLLIEELDEWKSRYFDLLQEFNNQRLEMQRMRMEANLKFSKPQELPHDERY